MYQFLVSKTCNHIGSSMRPLLHYTGEKWKRSFISRRLGLPSKLIWQENGGFRKRSSNRRNLKTRLFFSTVRPFVHLNPSGKWCFSKALFTTEVFENAHFAFWENDEAMLIMHDHMTSLPECNSNTNPKVAGADCCVLKFIRCSVDRKHLMRFQSKTSVFKFLRGSVDGA